MRMKFLHTWLIIFLSTSFVCAEIGPKGRRGFSHKPISKGFVGLSIGAGLPLNDYGKAEGNPLNYNLSSTDSIQGFGFAKIGVSFNLTAGYKFLPFLGGMVMGSGTINGFNVDAIQDTTHPILKSTSYFIGKGLVGPFLYFSSGKVDLSFRALAGLAYVKYPTITRTSSGKGYSSVSTFETPSATGFGYNIGASLNFILSDHVGFLINADYFGTKLNYKDVKSSTNIVFSGITTSSESTDHRAYPQSIGLFHFTVGLALLF